MRCGTNSADMGQTQPVGLFKKCTSTAMTAIQFLILTKIQTPRRQIEINSKTSSKSTVGLGMSLKSNRKRGGISQAKLLKKSSDIFILENFEEGLAIRERLAPYRSNVLIVDEYQDLDHSLTFLFLLLHKGEAESTFHGG